MKQDIRIARVFGIEISLHWTFFLLPAWLIFSNVSSKSATEILSLLALVFLLFTCVILHELGHALTARRFGIKTKSIRLYPIGGVASLEKIPEKPVQELLVSLAGPAVNLVIAGILFPVFYFSGGSVEDISVALAGPVNLLPALLIMNLSLAIFNLVPAFPMDGGRVFRALLSMMMSRDKATRVAMRVGQVIAVLFIFIGFSYNMMLVVIGAFIFIAGQSEAVFVHAKAVLGGFHASDAVMKNFHSIEASMLVDDAVRMLLNGQGSDILVTENGRFTGSLSRDSIIRALSDRGAAVPVSSVMERELKTIQHDTALDRVYEELMLHKQAVYPVLKNGELLGVIDAENILEFMMVQDALAHRLPKHNYQH
ncbi:MAG: Peptidase M50 [Bacteroidetes bacterium]|nr:MAG: Peptidase M50 [Bacteroidota bacterium]